MEAGHSASTWSSSKDLDTEFKQSSQLRSPQGHSRFQSTQQGIMKSCILFLLLIAALPTTSKNYLTGPDLVIPESLKTNLDLGRREQPLQFSHLSPTSKVQTQKTACFDTCIAFSDWPVLILASHHSSTIAGAAVFGSMLEGCTFQSVVQHFPYMARHPFINRATLAPTFGIPRCSFTSAPYLTALLWIN